MELLKADIILVHGTELIDDAIELVTDSPWSHAAMVHDPAKSQLIEAKPFRVVQYAEMKQYKDRSLILRINELSEEQREQITRFAQGQLGKPYDYRAILEEFERYEWKHRVDVVDYGRFICSTLIFEAYKSAGVELTKEKLASPDDLYRSEATSIVGRF